jgi:ABC-2 type transport system ATP-binding protein
VVLEEGGPRVTHPILEVRNVTVRYGTRCVLSDVDLCVASGEWFALMGPNGSGKTTLLRCVSGQLTPATGRVHVGGHSVLEIPEKAKHFLGYAHPPDRLPELLTGRQCLEIYAAAHDLAEIPAEILDLAIELKLSPMLDDWCSTYSLGMRQKLSILLALINDPALIVLDEALNGLDPASVLLLKRELRERVARRHAAVLLATHALDVGLREATRAGLLLDGRLVKIWSRDELDCIRASGVDALESALAGHAGSAH